MFLNEHKLPLKSLLKSFFNPWIFWDSTWEFPITYRFIEIHTFKNLILQVREVIAIGHRILLPDMHIEMALYF